jgi:hypothetical protein
MAVLSANHRFTVIAKIAFNVFRAAFVEVALDEMG